MAAHMSGDALDRLKKDHPFDEESKLANTADAENEVVKAAALPALVNFMRRI